MAAVMRLHRQASYFHVGRIVRISARSERESPMFGHMPLDDERLGVTRELDDVPVEPWQQGMAAPEPKHHHHHDSYILGVDVGTTTVKVALLNDKTGDVVRMQSRESAAGMHSDLGSAGNEQDPQKILTAVQFCVSGLPKEELSRVKRVGIAGQMHGIVLWKREGGWARNTFGRFEVGKASQLFTWQDRRCSQEFVAELPEPQSHLRLASGLGCCTLLWLARHRPDFLAQYDCAGTIQDFLVAMLCGLERPVMSVHNAASWGYFDTVTKEWNLDILEKLSFPTHFLPEVIDPSAVAGTMQEVWYVVPVGVPVGAALGDLQCSIYSALKESDNAVLNISTSAQLAFQMDPSFVPPPLDVTSTIEYFPYFKGRYLAVAASLTGGNVMAQFVKMLQQWTHELGLGVPQTKIWEKLQTLSTDCTDTDLQVCPTIYGERHDPSQRASVSNITALNTTLSSVFCALCRGIISNLHSMMSQDFLLAAGVKSIIGSGTAVIRNKLIQKEIEQQYKLPLELGNDSHADAAIGAALAMMKDL